MKVMMLIPLLKKDRARVTVLDLPLLPGVLQRLFVRASW
jgi:hypothetical protein